MEVEFGRGKSKNGPGIEIKLKSDEVINAINCYLTAHNTYVGGPRIITMNGGPIKKCSIHVDTSGHVISDGKQFLGNGKLLT